MSPKQPPCADKLVNIDGSVVLVCKCGPSPTLPPGGCWLSWNQATQTASCLPTCLPGTGCPPLEWGPHGQGGVDVALGCSPCQ